MLTVQEKLRDRQVVPVGEAATLLGVGRQTLYDAITRGEVPNAGIGSAKRVPSWFLLLKLTPPNGGERFP
jgi:excisionase family DNA binding protein